MAFVHGKGAIFKVGTNDISAFTNSVEFEATADTHDTTTFGQTGHTYAGGLTDGKVQLKGLYDNTTSTGPRDAIDAVLGTSVAFTYQPEGTGTGKVETTGNAVVKSYKETAPVADMVTWEAELTISGAVTTDVQV